MMRNSLLAAFAATLLFGTAHAQDEAPEAWAHLPEPVTNNAVAGAMIEGREMAYSFAGLHEGKTWQDVTADAYACDLEARTCREIDPIPDGIGRLASVAVNVQGQIYIFGGYTVAEDGSESSTPEVWRFNPATETYTHITNMPVPVDDTVALAHQDRYIYLVSGWHDTDNVDQVQVYDVEEGVWFEATPFPGAPVFGHAGAIDSVNRIHICGGTAVIPPTEPGGRRSFAAIDDCWIGSVDESLALIEWVQIGSVPGGPFYRGIMVSRSEIGALGLYLTGGSANAYNYNGIGYDGDPVAPRNDRLAFSDVSAERCDPEEPQAPEWQLREHGSGVTDSLMDIRGSAHGFAVGGMVVDQQVSDQVVRLLDLDDVVITTVHCILEGQQSD
jgi:hypothetical protein